MIEKLNEINHDLGVDLKQAPDMSDLNVDDRQNDSVNSKMTGDFKVGNIGSGRYDGVKL